MLKLKSVSKSFIFFIIATNLLISSSNCNSQEIPKVEESAPIVIPDQKFIEDKKKDEQFISLKFIANNSKVGRSPNVKYIGLLDTSTNQFQGFNSNQKPTSLASTAKVLVALAVLEDIQNGRYSLKTSTTIPNWARATSGNVGSNVKQNIINMLKDSDNNSTNALIVKAGSFEGINTTLKKYGLNNSKINCVLSPKTVTTKSCIGTNQSTMKDLVNAMNLIRIRDNTISNFMISNLKKSRNNFNHTNGLYNKYGVNSLTLADVGVIATDIKGVNKEYVYAINCDFKGSNDSGNNYKTIGPNNPTKLLTDKKDPVSKVIQWIVNDLEKGFKIKTNAD